MILKGSLIIIGIVSVGYIAFAVATMPDFARLKAERVRDDCEAIHGKKTQESVYCMMAILARLETERRSAEMDAIYRRAR